MAWDKDKPVQDSVMASSDVRSNFQYLDTFLGIGAGANPATSNATNNAIMQRDANGGVSVSALNVNTNGLVVNASKRTIIGPLSDQGAGYKLQVAHSVAGESARIYLKHTDPSTGTSHSILSVVTEGPSSGDPIVSFSTSVNSFGVGIDNSDGDKFQICEGGPMGTNVRLAIVPTTGNVLIGTTTDSTAYKLQVAGSMRGYSLQLTDANAIISTDTVDGSDTKRLQLAGGGTVAQTRGAYMNLHGNEHATYPGWASVLAGGTSGIINFFTSWGEICRMTEAGKVLIGTTSDDGVTRLQVSGNIKLKGSSDIFYLSPTTGYAGLGCTGSSRFDFYCGAGSETRMSITQVGNILIGTVTDDGINKVQVNGAAKATSLFALGAAGVSSTVFQAGVIGVTNGYTLTVDASNNITHNWAGNSGLDRMKIVPNGNVLVGAVDDSTNKFQVEGPIRFKPAASATPANNGDVVFEATSNTTVKLKLKGTDGVVRSVSLTLV